MTNIEEKIRQTAFQLYGRKPSVGKKSKQMRDCEKQKAKHLTFLVKCRL